MGHQGANCKVLNKYLIRRARRTKLRVYTLFCLFANYEPIGFEEAIQDKRWKVAMDEEIKSIRKNDT